MVTIRDVAAAAGVSTATVTRALTKPETVATPTADRVRQAVQDLGYRPNLVARSLRRRTAQVVGLVMQDIETPHFMSVCRGAEDALREHSYSATFCNTDDKLDRERAYLEVLVDQSVAGIIMTPASATESDLGWLHDRGLPVVTLEMELSGAVDSVYSDNQAGACAAVRHLLEAGAARPACVTGGRDVPSAQDRLAGYQQALRRAGLPLEPDLWAFTDYREEQGEAAVRALFALPQPPDALFLANSRLLVGALRALRALGRQVPDDVTLASFDETPLMELLTPPVTTVRQRAYEIGQRAAQLLLERIGGYAGPARHITLMPELIIRSSSIRPDPTDPTDLTKLTDYSQ
ncbi:MAG: LacI family transcriptional regulator [Bifidobacteriaceae bacterium]|jgi:LacI family transcriptional regulator|nr:LacI family transcriptional regulator [Bifidobacteriaceae bacterium]